MPDHRLVSLSLLIGAILISTSLVYLGHCLIGHAETGRYHMAVTSGSLMILDTQTGRISGSR